LTADGVPYPEGTRTNVVEIALDSRAQQLADDDHSFRSMAARGRRRSA
jgi:hypothetical protein